jgi:ABC-type nitrate/sulfonate/bicarbonate transport system permease component
VTGAPSIGGHALWPVATGLALTLVWELGARARLPAYVPRPSGIIAAFPSVVTTSLFWTDALSTCSAIVEGVVVGTVVGAVLGLVMGRVREVGWLLAPLVRSLYSMPLIALVPIMVLWMGYTETARLVAIAIAVVLPVAVSTSDGARLLPPEFLDVGKVFRARPHQVWFGIALPAALPQLLAGVDIGIGRAFTNGVAVEVLASVSGLGYQLFDEAQSLRDEVSFVYVIALAVFAIAARTGVRMLSRRLAPWYRPREPTISGPRSATPAALGKEETA